MSEGATLMTYDADEAADDARRDDPTLPGGPEYDGGQDTAPTADPLAYLATRTPAELRAEIRLLRQSLALWMAATKEANGRATEYEARAAQMANDNLDLIDRLGKAEAILDVEAARDAARIDRERYARPARIERLGRTDIERYDDSLGDLL